MKCSPLYYFTVLMLSILFLFAACSTDVYVPPGDEAYLGDLEMQWRVEGYTDPSLCDTFDISFWIAEASGPEYRQSQIDCRFSAWSTEGDFYGLTTGLYTISVTAFNSFSQPHAKLSIQHNVIASGFLDVYTFDFYASDFGL